MDTFHTCALALQKHLLNLRQELAALDEKDQQHQIEQLVRLIAHLESALAALPPGLRPATLQ